MAQLFDVIVVGAGLSGIGAAHHLKRLCPDHRFAVLEARAASGGTWDLFRYPGIRSDSDMFTLGYGFRSWTGNKAIADGATIRDYIRDTAREGGIEPHIRYRHRLTHAAWSSADARWTLTVEHDGATLTFACRFLYMCTGYYDYAAGYRPGFAGEADFAGRIVHPQFWPDDLDHAGRRVAVIGSGATAVTLVPAMAGTAAQVTMVQRSPSYVLATPTRDPLLGVLRRVLPWRAAFGIARWLRIGISQYFYVRSRRKPQAVRRWLLREARKALPPGYDLDRHFTPRYDPWDQRLCIVPDGDLFAAIASGKASVVTGTIDRFTPGGIRMADGTEVPADVIVTATGLELQLFGKATLRIDGVPTDPARAMNYRGMMFSDLPNLAYAFGYTNASWTLRADLTARYVCRLLNHMRARGHVQATPRIADADLTEEPLLDFSSSYVRRGRHRLPKQGSRAPWRVRQSYLRDRLAMRFARLTEQIEFR